MNNHYSIYLIVGIFSYLRSFYNIFIILNFKKYFIEHILLQSVSGFLMRYGMTGLKIIHPVDHGLSSDKQELFSRLTYF